MSRVETKTAAINSRVETKTAAINSRVGTKTAALNSREGTKTGYGNVVPERISDGSTFGVYGAVATTVDGKMQTSFGYVLPMHTILPLNAKRYWIKNQPITLKGKEDVLCNATFLRWCLPPRTLSYIRATEIENAVFALGWACEMKLDDKDIHPALRGELACLSPLFVVLESVKTVLFEVKSNLKPSVRELHAASGIRVDRGTPLHNLLGARVGRQAEPFTLINPASLVDACFVRQKVVDMYNMPFLSLLVGVQSKSVQIGSTFSATRYEREVGALWMLPSTEVDALKDDTFVIYEDRKWSGPVSFDHMSIQNHFRTNAQRTRRDFDANIVVKIHPPLSPPVRNDVDIPMPSPRAVALACNLVTAAMFEKIALKSMDAQRILDLQNNSSMPILQCLPRLHTYTPDISYISVESLVLTALYWNQYMENNSFSIQDTLRSIHESDYNDMYAPHLSLFYVLNRATPKRESETKVEFSFSQERYLFVPLRTQSGPTYADLAYYMECTFVAVQEIKNVDSNRELVHVDSVGSEEIKDLTRRKFNVLLTDLTPTEITVTTSNAPQHTVCLIWWHTRESTSILPVTVEISHSEPHKKTITRKFALRHTCPVLIDLDDWFFGPLVTIRLTFLNGQSVTSRPAELKIPIEPYDGHYTSAIFTSKCLFYWDSMLNRTDAFLEKAATVLGLQFVNLSKVWTPQSRKNGTACGYWVMYAAACAVVAYRSGELTAEVFPQYFTMGSCRELGGVLGGPKYALRVLSSNPNLAVYHMMRQFCLSNLNDNFRDTVYDVLEGNEIENKNTHGRGLTLSRVWETYHRYLKGAQPSRVPFLLRAYDRFRTGSTAPRAADPSIDDNILKLRPLDIWPITNIQNPNEAYRRLLPVLTLPDGTQVHIPRAAIAEQLTKAFKLPPP